MTSDLVFLSHRPEGTSASWADRFSSELAHRGVSVWKDRPAVDDPFESRLEGIRSSDLILFLVDPETMESPWALAELGAVIASRKPIIPIVPATLAKEQVPGPLRRRDAIPMGTPEETATRYLQARG